MAEPPASPSSSDLTGVDRDQPKLVRRGKLPEENQEVLCTPQREDAARPPNDPEISPEGNAQ
jgi:hypothetical protein